MVHELQFPAFIYTLASNKATTSNYLGYNLSYTNEYISDKYENLWQGNMVVCSY